MRHRLPVVTLIAFVAFLAACSHAAHEIEAGPPDAGSPPRPTARPLDGPCAPSDGGAARDAVCLGGRQVMSCTTRAVIACAAGTSCVPWADPSTHHLRAACVAPDRADVCDPTHDTVACLGSTQRRCVRDSSVVPPYWVRTDCHDTWGADATCRVSPTGTLGCVSPGDVPCDPHTFAATCAQQCVASDTSPTGGVVRPFTCSDADAPQCVAVADGVACVPADAAPGPSPPSRARRAIGCEGHRIRFAQYGYEWTRDCPDHTTDRGDGPRPYPTRCFAPPDGSSALCVVSQATLCRVDRGPRTCVDDTHVTYCENWQRVTFPCATFGQATVCDPAVGACSLPPPCRPGYDFLERCAGPRHKWVFGTCPLGVATAASCPACANTATGVTCGRGR